MYVGNESHGESLFVQLSVFLLCDSMYQSKRVSSTARQLTFLDVKVTSGILPVSLKVPFKNKGIKDLFYSSFAYCCSVKFTYTNGF